MVPLAYQWYHWLTNGTNCTIGRVNGTIGITIGTNGITNGIIGKTLNDIGIPLVPLGNPEHTQFRRFRVISVQNHLGPGFTFLASLSQNTGVAEINTQRPFRSPLLLKTPIDTKILFPTCHIDKKKFFPTCHKMRSFICEHFNPN